MPLGARGGGLVGDIVQNVHQNQKTEQCGKQDYNQYSQNAFNTLAFSALANGGGLSVPVGHSRTNSGASTLVQTEKPSMRSSEDYVSDQGKMQGGFIASNGYGSLDDIMTGIMKRVPSFSLCIYVCKKFGSPSFFSLFMSAKNLSPIFE